MKYKVTHTFHLTWISMKHIKKSALKHYSDATLSRRYTAGIIRKNCYNTLQKLNYGVELISGLRYVMTYWLWLIKNLSGHLVFKDRANSNYVSTPWEKKCEMYCHMILYIDNDVKIKKSVLEGEHSWYNK